MGFDSGANTGATGETGLAATSERPGLRHAPYVGHGLTPDAAKADESPSWFAPAADGPTATGNPLAAGEVSLPFDKATALAASNVALDGAMKAADIWDGISATVDKVVTESGSADWAMETAEQVGHKKELAGQRIAEATTAVGAAHRARKAGDPRRRR